MRYLAIRQQGAGPATRPSSAQTITPLIFFLLTTIVWGEVPQQGWQYSDNGTRHPDAARLWNLPLEEATSPNWDHELFNEVSPAPQGWEATASSVTPVQHLSGELFEVTERDEGYDGTWQHQVLPDGLIYRSYLAGVKEPRFAGQWVHDVDLGWMWDITLGGRVGVLRYGTTCVDHPEGWQLDMEGAGMPRLDLSRRERDLIASDFRFGVPLTYGRGSYQTKFAYYHLSSHLGDEFMVRHATLERRNYSRDVIVWGHSYFLTADVRVYGEAGWAFTYDGGTEPWEFQVGIDYSPAKLTGQRGSPFVAINGHLRQEFDFGGNIVVQTGWQWRGYSGHLFRIGMHYFQGMSDQWELFDQFEDKLGFGVWYDF